MTNSNFEAFVVNALLLSRFKGVVTARSVQWSKAQSSENLSREAMEAKTTLLVSKPEP
jgi:hypothetical protein